MPTRSEVSTFGAPYEAVGSTVHAPGEDEVSWFEMMATDDESFFYKLFVADLPSIVETAPNDNSSVDASGENHCVEGTNYTEWDGEPAKALMNKEENGKQEQLDLAPAAGKRKKG
ncbi:hypothetical protein QFC22_002408 [Naganishia vaughanmartiniae]|uniref:Uncharacterized protein n=1 Tax=Naganishia vaughanmartiniae TaxID=1424756 RepID=A0ACC2XEH5_9TREE|nr:hypothetical protein QFC22_002408 [Naganishia vaughanmartiniae]